MVENYSHFLAELEKWGCIPMSQEIPGLPALASLCPEYLWHTGDPDSDPWMFRTRIAAEKKGAYGCLLGGRKAFVSASFFPVAYAACRVSFSMDERYEAGLTSWEVYRMYRLFRERRVLATFGVRELLQGEMKHSAQDRALIVLQREWIITVIDGVRKLNRSGEPYGWNVNLYGWMEDWAPEEWRRTSERISQTVARRSWLRRYEDIAPDFSWEDFCRMMAWDVRGC
ncbi:MAG: AlkZ-related protein [Christensenellales bacterium]|jgi:hypothetical protein